MLFYFSNFCLLVVIVSGFHGSFKDQFSIINEQSTIQITAPDEKTL